jgi:acyl CoA:acetate/3-ketoacid CoA transferase alpha subunit
MEVLESGEGRIYFQDPDDVRAWMRNHKDRGFFDKTMTEKEAVEKFVDDGDYISYDLSSMVRGPISLEREIVRQKKKDLWLSAKFTFLDTTLLVGGGCVSKIDIGFAGIGKVLIDAIRNEEVHVIDWSNGTLAARHLAGAMGVPFIPVRGLLGSDTFKTSGAKKVTCPFSGKPVALVPAINPDVAIIHVNECDKYGNSRIYGPSITPVETALASKKVIIATEKLIDPEDIRKNPGLTTIPYFAVNAVCHVPWGAHPGTVPGYYAYDTEHLNEFFKIKDKNDMKAYLDKFVYGTKDNAEYIELVGGEARMQELVENETIKEGYHYGG